MLVEAPPGGASFRLGGGPGWRSVRRTGTRRKSTQEVFLRAHQPARRALRRRGALLELALPPRLQTFTLQQQEARPAAAPPRPRRGARGAGVPRRHAPRRPAAERERQRRVERLLQGLPDLSSDGRLPALTGWNGARSTRSRRAPGGAVRDGEVLTCLGARRAPAGGARPPWGSKEFERRRSRTTTGLRRLLAGRPRPQLAEDFSHQLTRRARRPGGGGARRRRAAGAERLLVRRARRVRVDASGRARCRSGRRPRARCAALVLVPAGYAFALWSRPEALAGRERR